MPLKTVAMEISKLRMPPSLPLEVAVTVPSEPSVTMMSCRSGSPTASPVVAPSKANAVSEPNDFARIEPKNSPLMLTCWMEFALSM